VKQTIDHCMQSLVIDSKQARRQVKNVGCKPPEAEEDLSAFGCPEEAANAPNSLFCNLESQAANVTDSPPPLKISPDLHNSQKTIPLEKVQE